ncbi:MAG: hypothetical protein PHO62_10965 [Sulfurimonas sp.]|uniref:hypothetical protein n=1 Tax=Sulfurimonas sp. TaxID=2022749 RepID=UPI00263152CA|nr:hypothetical protein [Sulfurimonas sp.]MDD5373931.1 hypothetical protein [Sulfurimonas sp.]
MKKKLFLLITLSTLSQAACVYVDCSDFVSSQTSQTQSQMQNEFQAIQNKLNTLENNYEKYAEALHENNKLYKKNKILKTEYLIILKKIDQKAKLLKSIEAAETN